MVCRGVSVLDDIVLQIEILLLLRQIEAGHMHGVTQSLQVFFVNGVIEQHVVRRYTCKRCSENIAFQKTCKGYEYDVSNCQNPYTLFFVAADVHQIISFGCRLWGDGYQIVEHFAVTLFVFVTVFILFAQLVRNLSIKEIEPLVRGF